MPEGKTDMERIGDKYAAPGSKPFNESASKNRQMIPGGSEFMANLLGGHFDAQFKRVFEGESYSDPFKQRRQHQMQQSKKNLGGKPYPNVTKGKPYPCSYDSREL
ncbi:UPF0602 protein C4orf47 homolog [Xenopus laevis]|uniref:Cilia-and flagella-associated protein 96 n=1 Tax=Xenopus laevis TaxID=8355 RepID=A0A8J0U820_XENLA|nr:UPF0602 protein C4orf47 homolog [Xenopus laevis]